MFPLTVYAEDSCIMQITQGDWFAVKGEKEKHNSIANYYNTYTQQHLYFKKEKAWEM